MSLGVLTLQCFQLVPVFGPRHPSTAFPMGDCAACQATYQVRQFRLREACRVADGSDPGRCPLFVFHAHIIPNWPETGTDWALTPAPACIQSPS